MMDREITWVLTKPGIRFYRDSTGSKQEPILRNGADSVTPVQSAVDQESEPNALL
jgi:hypothetical protein